MARKNVKRYKRFLRRRWAVMALVIIVAIIVGIVIFHDHKAKPVAPLSTTAKSSTTTAVSKGSTSTPAATPPLTSAQLSNPATYKPTSPPSSVVSVTPTASGNPSAPSGTFVSNHGISPSPPVTQVFEESSVCNTTSGATCYISFTNGDITKVLPTELTDSSGAAYWNSWTPSSVGLTAGNWTVKAIAASTTQTVTTQDSRQLEVSE